MKKMRIPTMFSVHSSRVSDIRLDEGTTVARFRDILANDGYDVSDAFAMLTRHGSKDTVIGCIDFYVINEGDSVDFVTRKAATPVLSGMLEESVREAAKKDKEAERPEPAKPSAPKGHSCTCDCKCKDKASDDERGTLVIRGIEKSNALKLVRFLESL